MGFGYDVSLINSWFAQLNLMNYIYNVDCKV